MEELSPLEPSELFGEAATRDLRFGSHAPARRRPVLSTESASFGPILDTLSRDRNAYLSSGGRRHDIGVVRP